MSSRIRLAAVLAIATLMPWASAAQGPPPQGPPPGGQQGRQAGPGGMGGMQVQRQILAQFDHDKSGQLNAAERREARTWIETQPAMGPGGRGGRGGRGGVTTPPPPGPRLKPADVRTYGHEPLYDLNVLRTLFFQFENDDWEKEIMAFNNTDVEVPATLTVDGRIYRNVGVKARGMSSFFGVPEGQKHSLNISMDFVDDKQALLGYKTLNLLNSHEDPTVLRTVLYMQAAREYIPAPKANFVRVVLNGESWGIYPSAQQFNKEFINEWYKTTDGARWKVPGCPGGRGGLEYVGDDPAAYRRTFEIKSKDDPKAWAALMLLTKTLNTTPPEQLEKALAPMLDIDGALKFLAVDATLVNNDGYWTRASDYSIYLDTKGVFHIFPSDANETFGPGGGRGMGGPMIIMGPGGRGGGQPPPPVGAMPPPGAMPPGGPQGRGGMMRLGGADLDPLVGLDDAAKPLRSKLLAVPALRARYMTYVKQIATKWLDWNTLGPLAQKYQALIAADVKMDTRKLDTFEAFQTGIETLKAFAEKRRAYLLNYK